MLETKILLVAMAQYAVLAKCEIMYNYVLSLAKTEGIELPLYSTEEMKEEAPS